MNRRIRNSNVVFGKSNPFMWVLQFYIAIPYSCYFLPLQFSTLYWCFGFFQKPLANIVLWQINCFFAILISLLPPSLVYFHHCPRAAWCCKEGFSKKISSEALVCCITHILLAQHCEQTSLEGLIFWCSYYVLSPPTMCLQNQESPELTLLWVQSHLLLRVLNSQIIWHCVEIQVFSAS